MAPWRVLFPCLLKRKKVGSSCDFHGVTSVGPTSEPSSPPLPSRRFAQEETEECPNCHAVYTPGAKFCASCGHDRSKPAALKEKCPSCGTVYTPAAKFCAHCGHRKGAQVSESPQLPGALQAAVPDGVGHGLVKASAPAVKAAVPTSAVPLEESEEPGPKPTPAKALAEEATPVKAPTTAASPDTGAIASSPPEEGNYIVELRRTKPTDRFGFAWDAKKLEKENARVISKVLPGTLAEAWNRTAPPGRDVRPGDLLVKVNGQKGRIELLTVELSKLHIICEFRPEEPRNFAGAEASAAPLAASAAPAEAPRHATPSPKASPVAATPEPAPALTLPAVGSPPPPQPATALTKAAAAASPPPVQPSLPKAAAASVSASIAAPGAPLPVAVPVAKSAVCPPAAVSTSPTAEPALAAAIASPTSSPATAPLAVPTPVPAPTMLSTPPAPAPTTSTTPAPALAAVIASPTPAPALAAVDASPAATPQPTPTPAQPSDLLAKDRFSGPSPAPGAAAAQESAAEAPSSGQPPEDPPPMPGEAPLPPQLPPQPLEALGAPSDTARSASSCVEILEDCPAETPELDHPSNGAMAEPATIRADVAQPKEIARGPEIAEEAKEEPAIAEPAGGLYVVELQRGALSEKWGFQWDRKAMDSQNLRVIEGIAPNSLASDWNRRFPDRSARKGDQLMKVNGLRDAAGMAAELKKSQVTCEFRSALPRDGDAKAQPIRPRPELTPLKMPAAMPEPASVAVASG